MWWPGYDIVMGIMWSVCAVWKALEVGGNVGIWIAVMYGALAVWSFIRAAVQLVHYYQKSTGKM